jgi:hypothetical protein
MGGGLVYSFNVSWVHGIPSAIALLQIIVLYFTQKYPVPYFTQNYPVPYFTQKYPVPYFTQTYPVPYFTQNYPVPYFSQKYPVPYFTQNYPVPYFTQKYAGIKSLRATLPAEIFTRILIFKGLTARRLYKSFDVRVLTTQFCSWWCSKLLEFICECSKFRAIWWLS